MKTSETISNLTKALVKAQMAMGAASKASNNPFFKSKYAGLPQVMEVVKAPLNDNGLIVLQPGVHRDGKNFIDTVILHAETGEYISSETEVVIPTNKVGDPQAAGSAQTYARRFGLQALLFIPAEDMDAEDLQDRKTTPKQTYTKPTADPKALAQVSAAPATTNEVALDETPMGANNPEVKTVEIASKSSFRKQKTVPKVEAAPATEEGW